MGAAGSGTKCDPSITNEYVCRPGSSGTYTVHVPSAPWVDMGLTCASHPLKSPTTETFDACGAIKTNLTVRAATESGSCG